MRAIRAAHAFNGTLFLRGGATIVVDGDRIVGVEAGHPDLPDSIPVSEYVGTVLPGLIDCHVHLVGDATLNGLERAGGLADGALDDVITDSLNQQLAGGVTTVRDLGDARYRTLGFRNRSGLPRVLAAGPPLTSVGGHCHYLGGEVAKSAGSLESAVAEHAEHGVDVIKVMATGGMLTPGTDVLGTQFTEAEIRRVVVAAHRYGLPVLAHAHSLLGAWNAVRAGVAGIEHVTCLTADGPQTPDELLVTMARRGVSFNGTLGWDQSRLVDLRQAPAMIQELFLRLRLSPDEIRASRGVQLLRAANHGVPIITGLDAGASPPKPHGDVWRAIVETAEALGSAAEALRSATSEAADACGLGGVTGRLAAGQSADVLIVDGDLSTDIGALAAPRLLLVRGEEVPTGRLRVPSPRSSSPATRPSRPAPERRPPRRTRTAGGAPPRA